MNEHGSHSRVQGLLPPTFSKTDVTESSILHALLQWYVDARPIDRRVYSVPLHLSTPGTVKERVLQGLDWLILEPRLHTVRKPRPQGEAMSGDSAR